MKHKGKINANKLIATQTDKGKTTVIIRLHKYKQYIQDVINNNYINLKRDPTRRHQK